MDFEKKTMDIAFSADDLHFNGKYNISGKILLLPIRGGGPTNITYVGGKYKYHGEYILEEKKNKQYIHIQKNKFTYDIQRAYYHLGNLFNGDKLLGEEMNKVLNENWKDVDTEIGSKLGDAVGDIGTSIMSGFFNRVAFEDMFLD